MNCENLQEKLIGYLDGELSAEEKVSIERHLGACSDCSKTALSYQNIREGYQALEEVEALPQAWLRLEEAIGGVEQTPWESFLAFITLRWKPITAVATAITVLVTVLIGMLILAHRPPSPIEIASLEEVSGNVEILRKKEVKWHELLPEEVINVGDRLRTDSSGRVTLSLKEIGKVKMYYDTDLEFKKYVPSSTEMKSSCLLNIYGGEIWTEVSPNKVSKFQIETPSGMVEVKGTKFYVRVKGGI